MGYIVGSRPGEGQWSPCRCSRVWLTGLSPRLRGVSFRVFKFINTAAVMSSARHTNPSSNSTRHIRADKKENTHMRRRNTLHTPRHKNFVWGVLCRSYKVELLDPTCWSASAYSFRQLRNVEGVRIELPMAGSSEADTTPAWRRKMFRRQQRAKPIKWTTLSKRQEIVR